MKEKEKMDKGGRGVPRPHTGPTVPELSELVTDTCYAEQGSK